MARRGDPREAGSMITACHTLIYTDDADATRAFLRDVLQLPRRRRRARARLAGLPDRPQRGSKSPDVEQRQGAGRRRPNHAISFMCDDIEATMGELRERGAEFSSGRTTTRLRPGLDDEGARRGRHPDLRAAPHRRPLPLTRSPWTSTTSTGSPGGSGSGAAEAPRRAPPGTSTTGSSLAPRHRPRSRPARRLSRVSVEQAAGRAPDTLRARHTGFKSAHEGGRRAGPRRPEAFARAVGERGAPAQALVAHGARGGSDVGQAA